VNLFAPRKIYSVSEITAQIKDLLETEFPEVLVEGEISNFTAAASGHLYFVLKDQGAQIKCAFFRQRARLLKFKPEDGLSVLASGRIGVYEPRGEYQLYVEGLEPKGIGSLQLAFEQLKAKLQAEGLFDAAHKKPLPLLPRTIGIVTSPTGAAVQDILRILGRRHQNLRVLLYPAKVQGTGAREEIAAGIEYLNTLGEIDVLIVGRGGGSMEDLWAFNEEIVARAISASRIPVISAVGHEIDFTIADFVADLRAPTPSAAAELVVLKKSEFTEKIGGLEQRLVQSFQYHLSRLRNSILSLSSDRAFASVESRLQRYQQRADELAFRLENCLQSTLRSLRSRLNVVVSNFERHDLLQKIRLGLESVRTCEARLALGQRINLHNLRNRAESLDRALEALNPLGVLQRGYAICRDAQGRVLKVASSLSVGDPFTVTLAKGEVLGRAEQISIRPTQEE
jgi:exodeoxyribonuclease VII large subunit